MAVQAILADLPLSDYRRVDWLLHNVGTELASLKLVRLIRDADWCARSVSPTNGLPSAKVSPCERTRVALRKCLRANPSCAAARS